MDRKNFGHCRWILPSTHDLDHRALVVRLETNKRAAKRHTKERRRPTFKKLQQKEMTEGERKFKKLEEVVDPSRRREHVKNS